MARPLALVPVDGRKVECVVAYLPQAELSELLVIRELLRGRRGELVDRLWALVGDGGIDSKTLRIACVLAAHDPDSERWNKLANHVAAELVGGNLFSVSCAFALRDARRFLLTPLAATFRDRNPDRNRERAVATSILADYAADSPEFLVELLKDADPRQYAELFPKVHYREEAVAGMKDELRKSLPASASEDEKDRL